MLRRLLSSAAFAAIALAASAQALWTSAEFKAPVGKHWAFDAEAEYRTTGQLKNTARYSGGAGAEYRLRQFRAEAGYVYIYQHNLSGYTRKGNFIPGYWTNRHRAYAGVSVRWKVGRVELSLRERYQFTHRVGRWVPKYGADGVTQKADEWIAPKDRHVLRTRLGADWSIRKKCPFKPYGTVEFYDDLWGAFSLEKIRFTAGCDYKINRHNSVGLYYRYIHTTDAANPDRGHVIGVGYSFKL